MSSGGIQKWLLALMGISSDDLSCSLTKDIRWLGQCHDGRRVSRHGMGGIGVFKSIGAWGVRGKTKLGKTVQWTVFERSLAKR